MEEKDFYEAIVNKKDLSERELHNLLNYEVARSYDNNRRWTRGVLSIIELCGHLFELDWDEALTECRGVFFDQPYEVAKEEKQVTTTVVTYVPLKEG